MTRILTSLALILTLCAFSTTADARPHRGGMGLICGAVQMAHFGITDAKYRLAKAWAGFQHVSAQVGAVVVSWRNGRDSAGNQGGHVARIVQLTNNPCQAIVADPRGQYKRDICKRQIAIVMPGHTVPGTTQVAHNSRHKHFKRDRGIQYASYVPVDRHSVH